MAYLLHQSIDVLYPLNIIMIETQLDNQSKATPSTLSIYGLELRVSYSVATISTKAKSFDKVYQVLRNERFDTLVIREAMRNPTKLHVKLLAQARNHFNMRYGRPLVATHYFALPESIRITRVEVVGLTEYGVTGEVTNSWLNMVPKQ